MDGVVAGEPAQHNTSTWLPWTGHASAFSLSFHGTFHITSPYSVGNWRRLNAYRRCVPRVMIDDAYVIASSPMSSLGSRKHSLIVSSSRRQTAALRFRLRCVEGCASPRYHGRFLGFQADTRLASQMVQLHRNVVSLFIRKPALS